MVNPAVYLRDRSGGHRFGAFMVITDAREIRGGGFSHFTKEEL